MSGLRAARERLSAARAELARLGSVLNAPGYEPTDEDRTAFQNATEARDAASADIKMIEELDTATAEAAVSASII